MQRLSRGPKLPLLRARSFRFDRRRRSLSVSATRPVRHSAPLRLSMIARSHEVDLVDTWRADVSVARLARNYPMCEIPGAVILRRVFTRPAKSEVGQSQ